MQKTLFHRKLVSRVLFLQSPDGSSLIFSNIGLAALHSASALRSASALSSCGRRGASIMFSSSAIA